MVNDSQEKMFRYEYIKLWKHSSLQKNKELLFPVETELLKLIELRKVKFFYPFNFKIKDEESYNKIISYFLDALDCLPLRPDSGFDFMWKSLESFISELGKEKGYVIGKLNVNNLLVTFVESEWWPKIKDNENLKNILNQFYAVIPSQTYEYFSIRIFEEYVADTEYDKQTQDYKRFTSRNDAKRIDNIDNICSLIYKNIIIDKSNISNDEKSKRFRNAGRLLHKLLKGEKIKLKINQTDEKEFSFNSDEERLLFISKGLLYTLRNERIHGNTFSPFRSSHASIKTYTHAHYCFLFTYFLLLLSLHLKYSINYVSIDEIVLNVEANINEYKILYGRNLRN